MPTTSRAYTFQSTGLYHSYSELSDWAYGLQAQEPNLVRVIEYGTTTSGRALLAVNITVDPPADDPAKPEFLFTAGVHAREVITSEVARTLAETLVSGYQSGDPVYVDMLSERDVWIVPDHNPDGRIAVEAGRSDQRKNDHLYPLQTPAHYSCGVDLNRNYPHKWNYASSSVRSETYRGPSVLSEPESSSLWALLHDESKFSNLLAAIDYHSGASMIISPWMSKSEFAGDPLPAEDRQKLDFLAERMSEESGYPVTRLTYDLYGTLTDSLYEEFGTYAFCEEVFKGPFIDYFTYFNPVDAETRDAAIENGVNSALFLLSDEAFDVPEPSVLALLTMGTATLLRRRRKTGHC